VPKTLTPLDLGSYAKNRGANYKKKEKPEKVINTAEEAHGIE
jgi:hypothetical protein